MERIRDCACTQEVGDIIQEIGEHAIERTYDDDDDDETETVYNERRGQSS